MKKHPLSSRGILALVAGLAFAASASAVPEQLHYQGRANINGLPVTGSTPFKFALGDATFSTTYWSNDGSSVAGSEPTGSVAVDVQDSLYGVYLGDTSLTNMTPVSHSVFVNSNVHLRVWVDGGTGFEQLVPDQPIVAVGYAMRAAVLDGGIDDADANPTNELNGSISLNASSLELVDAGGTLSVDLGGLGVQSASLTGSVLQIESGLQTNAVDLGSLIDDADASPTNEIQMLSILGTNLTLSGGGGTVALPAGGGGGADTDWVDDGTNVYRSSGRVVANVFLGGTGSLMDPTVSYGAIGGGQNNSIGAGDDWTVIGGGLDNRVDNDYATIGGGRQNVASALYSTVGGGWTNRALDSYTTIGGGRLNWIRNGDYATIAGGQGNEVHQPWGSIGGGGSNLATNWYATISGGDRNIAAGDSSVVSGGWTNRAMAIGSTAGGGRGNYVSGSYACVPGGRNNRVYNQYGYAHGRFAQVVHDGAWVWADSVNIQRTSTANNQFMARASGGFVFYSNSGSTTGAELPANQGAWVNLSDRNAKDQIEPINNREVLERLAEVPVSTWKWKSENDSIRHMGPMAQDFHAAFGLGNTDKGISTADADGVALAAIQGLHELVEEKDAQVQQVIQQKDAQIQELTEQLQALQEQVNQLVGHAQ